MEIVQCRNAMLIITYAGKRILIDPVFAPKGTYPPFPSRKRPEAKNPLHYSPIPIAEMCNVDGVIITHLHIDHFDHKARELLPKDLPVFVQNADDQAALAAAGFRKVEMLTEETRFGPICLSKTGGRHGYDDAFAERLGPVCGVVFRGEGEETLYLAGDTVWCGAVAKAIDRYTPGVIILNAGGNSDLDTQLIMGSEDVRRVHEAAPSALLVATHMEGYNHWTVSQTELRSCGEANGFGAVLSVPEDGERLVF